MNHTNYVNGSGLPDKRQITTARDMAKLGVALQRDFPIEYKLFATKSFKFRGRVIRGHNNLMYRYKGMDGIKTGYTNASGFNIVSAINDKGRHLIGVVLGGTTARSRDNRMAALLDQAMPRATTGKIAVAQAAGKSPFGLPKTNVPAPLPAVRHENTQIASADDGVADLIQANETDVRSVRTSDNWAVQIAATNSREMALTLLAQARSGMSNSFSHILPSAQAITRESTTLYRARFTGFDERSVAVSACKELRSHDYDCIVVQGHG
jgi:D-alanyl-D-alanine carboxypeptidase (penicillin-binding protein 5/6)